MCTSSARSVSLSHFLRSQQLMGSLGSHVRYLLTDTAGRRARQFVRTNPFAQQARDRRIHKHTHTPLMPTQQALMAWSSLLRSAGLGHHQPVICGERMWSPAQGSHACTRLLLARALHLGGFSAKPQGPTRPNMTMHHPP